MGKFAPMQFNRKNIDNDTLIELYRSILLPRLIEEKMLVLLRQGKISKWFSGIGQEAIAVGVTKALDKDEWIMPLHRNLGVFTGRNMPLSQLFKQWQGFKDGYSKGRERSFHFGSREHHICGMISHLGPQLAIADGVALAHKLRKENKVAVTFTGDGGTSEGDFHEALNTASVWDLPVIFIIENNGYGLSTPTNEQFRCNSLVDRAIGYGMEGTRIDGNNILEVFDTIRRAKTFCIENQRPILIECMTFRMRGHEEASGVKYVPKELFEQWEQLDPVDNYEAWLIEQQILNEDQVSEIRKSTKQYIETELQQGFLGTPPDMNPSEELQDVYAPRLDSPKLILDPALAESAIQQQPGTEKKFIQAIHEALDLSMQAHPNLVLMGQDIAEYGGAFKVTEGMMDRYGKERVRNTPLCESAIVGAALGLSLEGHKAMMEMQFADFVTVGFNQIVNNLAKIHYRWGQNADVVIRMPTGGGVGAGPFHSQSNEAWFTHVPGLKVVYPSSPVDAKGLLMASINDPNPVIFFEHKGLYRSIQERVPDAGYEIEIGKARLVKAGDELSIITYGMGVHWALDYQKQHPEISIDILDLRTLLPLDFEAIRASVKRTGKLIVLHEDTLFGGIGGEISAWVTEHCFEYLDAPILRCASMDTPVPFNIELEKQFMAKARLDETVQKIMAY
jgi:2-oxoisovalerate dehydrogenase E1 component